MAKVADGIRYAERVVAGEIVAGEFVRLACQRFLPHSVYDFRTCPHRQYSG